MVETTCEINLYKLRALFYCCTFGAKLTNWELSKMMLQRIKLVKDLLHLEIFMLVQWAVLLNGMNIKRAIYIYIYIYIYMLRIWKNNGIKFV